MVDLDVVLRLCMEEWAADAYRRSQKLASLFFAGDADFNGVLSLDEFINVINHVQPQRVDTEAVRMFREAVSMTEERRRRRVTHHKGTSAAARLACWSCSRRWWCYAC